MVRESDSPKQPNHLDNLVGVYGTLKRGYGNHRFLENAMYVGTGKTKERYPLVIRNWGLPFLIDKPDEGTEVEIELYLVDSLTFSHLDTLESHPSWYERKERPVIVDGVEYTPWLYFGPDDVYTGTEECHERY